MPVSISRSGHMACRPSEGAEMVREVGIDAGDRLAARQVLSLEGLSIGCQNEFRLGPGGRRAGLQQRQASS